MAASEAVSFIAEMDALEAMMQWVRSQLSKVSFSPAEQRKIELAMEEALVNIIRYAYGEKKGHIELSFSQAIEYVEFTVRDSGVSFNPLLESSHIDADRPLEEREEGGLGIMLIKEYMDEVHYKRLEPYNILRLIKKKPSYP